MKKSKYLFMLALLGTFLMSAGGVYAYTQTGVDVSFWVVDSNKPNLDSVTFAMANVSFDTSQHKLWYNDGSGWKEWDSYNGMGYEEKTFYIAEETKFQFKLQDVATGTFTTTGNLTFTLPTDDNPDLYKMIIVKWDDNTSLSFAMGGSDTFRSAVPIPSSALLLGSGVIGLIGFGVRRRNAGIS